MFILISSSIAIMGNETKAQTKVERVLNSKTVTEKYADVTLRLIEEHGDHVSPLTPEHAAKVKRKLYLRLMGLLSMINIMLFVGLWSHTTATGSLISCAD